MNLTVYNTASLRITPAWWNSSSCCPHLIQTGEFELLHAPVLANSIRRVKGNNVYDNSMSFKAKNAEQKMNKFKPGDESLFCPLFFFFPSHL